MRPWVSCCSTWNRNLEQAQEMARETHRDVRGTKSFTWNKVAGNSSDGPDVSRGTPREKKYRTNQNTLREIAKKSFLMMSLRRQRGHFLADEKIPLQRLRHGDRFLPLPPVRLANFLEVAAADPQNRARGGDIVRRGPLEE